MSTTNHIKAAWDAAWALLIADTELMGIVGNRYYKNFGEMPPPTYEKGPFLAGHMQSVETKWKGAQSTRDGVKMTFFVVTLSNDREEIDSISLAPTLMKHALVKDFCATTSTLRAGGYVDALEYDDAKLGAVPDPFTLQPVGFVAERSFRLEIRDPNS